MKPGTPRIAFVSTMPGSTWGGSEELWSRTALRLREKGCPVAASVFGWPQRPQKIRELQERGVAVDFRPPPGGSLLSKARSRLGRSFYWNRLRRHSPHLIVVSQGGIMDGLDCLRFCHRWGVPYVIIVHANTESWWPKDDARAEMFVFYRAARKIFCVSKENLRLLERQLGTSLPNAEVVWNPNNLSPGEPPPWPPEADGYRLACVGRLEPEAKGQDVLFQVLALPKWRERPVRLNLYGSGAGEEGLRRLAEYLRLEKVRFCGHVSEVNGIWKENHLLVMPSRMEGLPLALVEAMWCERPALVTNVGGNTELCVDGETGFVASAPVVDLLDQSLERAWQHRARWQTMGKAGRERVGKLVPKDPVGEFQKNLLRLVN